MGGSAESGGPMTLRGRWGAGQPTATQLKIQPGERQSQSSTSIGAQ